MRTRDGHWMWALVAAGIGILATRALHLNFLSDDAFITFRYARNLARGHGLAFNPGVRVEGYTNFLEVMILAALHRVGIDIVLAGRFFSLIGGVAMVALTYLVASRYAQREISAVASLLVAANPYVAAWTWSGMETTFFSALALAVALPLAARKPTTRQFLVVSGLGLFLALTRPEGVACFALAAIVVLVTTTGSLPEKRERLWPGLTLFAVLGGGYFAWRSWYFGDVLPNTFYAKMGFSTSALADGVSYLGHFALNPFVIVLLPLVVVGGIDLWRRADYLPPAMLTLIVAIVVLEGGDGLPMYRFLVPAVPWIAIVVAAGWGVLVQRWARTGWIVGGVAVVAAVGLSFLPNHDDQFERFVYQRDIEVPNWIAVGKALATRFPGATIAAVPVGAVAYYSDLPTIDMLGLTDRTIAHTPIESHENRWAGHERHNGAYVLSRRPEILLLGNVFVSPVHTYRSGAFPPYWNANIFKREEDLATDPAAADNYVPAVLQIDDTRYLHFFLRKDLASSMPEAPDQP